MLNTPGSMILPSASVLPAPAAGAATAGAAPLSQDGVVATEGEGAAPFFQTLLRTQDLLQDPAGTVAAGAGAVGQFPALDGKVLPPGMLEEADGPLPDGDEDGTQNPLAAASELAAMPAVEDALDADGDEGQVANALLPGMGAEAPLATPAGEGAAADLLARQSRPGLAGERAPSPVSAPVSAQVSNQMPDQAAAPGAEILAEAQRGATRSGDEGALRFSLLEGAQAAAATVQSADAAAPQQAPTQGPLQTTSLQAQPGDRSAAAMTLHTPLQQQAQWSEEMGQQVKWLVTQKMQSAELKLNPAHLGAVEIRITVQNDQVNLHFSTPHVQVKDSLEDSLPRLREIFQESGLNLADVDVSQQDTPQQQATADELPAAVNPHPGEQAEEGDGGRVAPAAVVRHGMVDFYA